MRPLFCCAQVVLALGMTLHGCGRNDSAKKPAASADGIPVGMVAPEIEGEDVRGEHFRLSDYRGNVVMLHFWFNS